MIRFNKVAGTAFKIATILYLLLILFKDKFRPDIYRLVSLPVEWCVSLLLLYLLGRWTLSKLGFFEAGSFKPNRKALLKALAAIVALLLLAAGFESLFQTFPLTQQALAILQSSPTGQAALGPPIRAGWFISGSAQVKGSDAAASLSIPVKGSRASGELDVTAIQKDGAWLITDLSLVTDQNKAPLQIAH